MLDPVFTGFGADGCCAGLAGPGFAGDAIGAEMSNEGVVVADCVGSAVTTVTGRRGEASIRHEPRIGGSEELDELDGSGLGRPSLPSDAPDLGRDGAKMSKEKRPGGCDATGGGDSTTTGSRDGLLEMGINCFGSDRAARPA